MPAKFWTQAGLCSLAPCICTRTVGGGSPCFSVSTLAWRRVGGHDHHQNKHITADRFLTEAVVVNVLALQPIYKGALILTSKLLKNLYLIFSHWGHSIRGSFGFILPEGSSPDPQIRGRPALPAEQLPGLKHRHNVKNNADRTMHIVQKHLCDQGQLDNSNSTSEQEPLDTISPPPGAEPSRELISPVKQIFSGRAAWVPSLVTNIWKP